MTQRDEKRAASLVISTPVAGQAARAALALFFFYDEPIGIFVFHSFSHCDALMSTECR